jgi:hypothetical protein
MKLFYVALYNHRSNEWARILLTETSKEAAAQKAEESMDDYYRRTWKARTVLEICSTQDEVWKEL